MEIMAKILCICLHQNGDETGTGGRVGSRGKKGMLFFHASNNTMYFAFETFPDSSIVSPRK